MAEIKRKFSKFGELVDLFIPRKKSKTGKVFGFARFVELKNEKRLEEQLRNVWFGTCKVWANISRFNREVHITMGRCKIDMKNENPQK